MYWSGLFTGIASTAIAVLAWLGLELGDVRAMYAEFGGPVPALTSLVLHPAFRWLVPVALLVGLVVANLREQKPRAVLVALAAVGVIVVVLEYWGARLPLHALAAPIQAD